MFLKYILFLTTVSVFVSEVISDDKLSKSVNEMDFEVVGSKTYLIFENPLINWYNASIICQKLGLQLATFGYYGEQVFLNDYLTYTERFVVYDGIPEGFWIALSNENTSGVWTWTTTGKELDYYGGWAPGQPDNLGAHCATLWYNGLDDDFCEISLRGFICEKV